MVCHPKSGARRASALALIAWIPLLVLAGCSAGGGEHAAAKPTAELAVVALVPAAAASATVTVVDSRSTTVATQALSRQSDGRWTAVVTGIPVAAGYTVNVAAFDAGHNTLYAGSASAVSVTLNQTAAVVITAQQAAPGTPLVAAAPVIGSILVSSASTAPGGTITLSVSAQPGTAGDTLTYAWSAAAGTFSAQNPSGSVVTWTAPATTGGYVLTVAVSENGTTTTAQVSVAVSAGTGAIDLAVSFNSWPVVTSVVGTPNYVVPGAPTMLVALAADPDGDPTTYTWSSTCDASGAWSGQQTLTPSFTLATGAASTSCAFTVTVADNRGGSGTGTLTLPVGKPTAAVAPSIGATAQSSATVGAATDTVTLTVNATDPQNLPLTFSWFVPTGGGTLGAATSTAGSSQVVWTPPAAAANSWPITVTVTNSANATASKTFTVVPSSCFGVPAAPSSAWSFGVMSDTQWIGTDDGFNPSSVAVSIINSLNAELIARNVRLVVAVGDLTDNGSNAALDTRAEFVQALYNAGIGFFPLRGNHESSTAGAAEFRRVFPQTLGGMQNATPLDAFVASADDVYTHPVAVGGAPFTAGLNFSQPSSVLTGTGNAAWDGLSYAFDYNNVRFVLLDQFMKPDGTSASGNYQITPQQPWISAALAGRPAGTHAFEFAHKGVITENHTDTLFGANPSVDPAGSDAFVASLATSGVRYHFGGHDHMHNRALVTTTDGTTAKVQNVICASDSSKFYIPANPSNDVKYDVPAFGHGRETPIAQELNTVGYYVVTVDGAKATVDFYSAEVNPTLASGEYLLTTTPPLYFTKRETFGYGLNGKQFVVPQGQSYTAIADAYGATSFAVLAGTNASSNVEAGGRNPVKTVDTGWTAGTCATSSDVLSLWTTASAMGSEVTDTLVLSLSYNPAGVSPGQLAGGMFGLATRDASGNWVNAVNRNVGGAKTFVSGPWQPGYTLGTYGVDPATNRAWAVVNHGTADFAVAAFARN